MNPQQTAAAHSTARTIICLAGPGSGKTTTLVEAVAAKARQDGPQRIICITFTNAGADEMRKRLQDYPDTVVAKQKFGYIGTLHAFLLREVRKHYRLIGLPCAPTVVDDESAALLLEEIIDAMGSRTSTKKILPLLKNTKLIEPPKIGTSYSRDDLVAVEYHRRMRAAGMVDMDALLYYGEKLIKTHHAAGGATFEYLHLFVDEAQDSADVDFRIYQEMPCITKFFVGDTDQAIYGFRGGNINNLINLANQPGYEAEVHVLQTNYRCEKAICQTANRLIEHNIQRIVKQTIPHSSGGKIDFYPCDDPTGEQFTISGVLQKELVTKPKGIAVLCRTNRLAQEIGNHLRAIGLPVATPTRQEDPADWKEAKLLLAAVANPHADLAWYKLAKRIDGDAAADRAKINASMNMTTVRQELAKLDRKWAQPDLESMIRILSHEARTRIRTAMDELEASGADWGMPDLTSYLQSGEQPDYIRPDAIFVGTVHAAKGREWDTVIIAGCEQGSFPQAKKDSDLEEERRLMFVAITRARKHLAFTWCKERPQSRGPNLPPGPMQPKTRSQFIDEIFLEEAAKNC